MPPVSPPIAGSAARRGIGAARPLLEARDFILGDVLCEADAVIDAAIFPSSGIVSLIGRASDGAALELGLLGREGLFGIPLGFGLHKSAVRAVVKGRGSSLRIDAPRFRRVLPSCPTLHARLRRDTYDLLSQVVHTAVCNAFHPIEARTARWMLSTADRMESSRFSLTQTFMADVLGVRRPAVSKAAGALMKAGLVRYSRGLVEIVDRPALENLACGCYRITDDLYRSALK